ncbi:type II toxin-antitoxin system VapC family toxin [Nocardiopsis chromatogenes]|uniref:type II toxin-antitoxin system VapC family toxin n=1 Tax=Nocardiopsis chromatogenes TaxID=280239 RepID=UPI000345AB1D|nr:PIN domain-containing protein [Nocardiopsis chromatogenes]
MAGRLIARGGTLVLDSEGLVKLAARDERARARHRAVIGRGGRIAVSAVTLAEVLRGARRDAAVHQVLKHITLREVTEKAARRAGELLGASGLSGHRCTIDAIVAATALEEERPVLLLTSDPADMSKLVEEPECPKEAKVVVINI